MRENVKHSTVHVEEFSEKIQSQIHFAFKEITFRASMAQWLICTTSNRWFIRSNLIDIT